MSKEFTDIHALVAQVSKDYQYKEIFSIPDWVKALWQKIWQFFVEGCNWLLAKLVRLFSQLGGSVNSAGVVGKWVVIIFVALLFCAVMGFIIWQHRHWIKKNLLHRNHMSNVDDHSDCLQTGQEWRQQAFTYKTQGRFHEACRSLHRACLQMLDEAHLIMFAPARSNYEYTIALGRLPALINTLSRKSLLHTFQTFSNTVDAMFFGNHPAGEAEFELCLKYLDEIESDIGKRIILATEPR